MTSIVKSILTAKSYGNLVDLGLLSLRLVTGVLMLTHGFPKLERMLAGNFNFADPVGLGPGVSLVLTVFAEFLCSILIATGLFTRLATIPLIITMFVIILIVHGGDPLLDHYNVILYLAGYIVLLITGSGKYSLDYLLQKRK